MYIKLHKLSRIRNPQKFEPHENLTIISYIVNSYITIISGIGTVAAIATMAATLFASFQRPKVNFTCRRLYYIITLRLTPCTKNAYNSLL